MKERASGILLHITSLPSRFGIGDLGPWAYRFADFLAQTGQSVWQILPLSPPRPDHYSPYLSPSAFAGNCLLISPELLVRDGLLPEREICCPPEFPVHRVDYRGTVAFKTRLLEVAFQTFRAGYSAGDYESFCRQNASWLDDYALFSALQRQQDSKVWSRWPLELRDRHPRALEEATGRLEQDIHREKFHQFLFFKQWFALKSYSNEKGIRVFGDVPIYVDYDSADVWTHPHLFKLDEERKPTVVSGVPPDYFSRTGQLWGHPIYRWELMKQSGYSWWLERIEHNLRLYDLMRIDHFRGFMGYWEVPAGEETAVNGTWQDGPGSDLFRKVMDRFPTADIVAEDLGVITPDVVEVMEEFGFPGMKVLMFAFGDDLRTNPYIPHNLVKNCIAYTGTHDNNTVRGWFENETTAELRQRVLAYLGHDTGVDGIHWSLLRLLMMSVAGTVIFPMQDILGLGQEDRMNTPSVTYGNWQWRLDPDALTQDLADKMLSMTRIYGRTPRAS